MGEEKASPRIHQRNQMKQMRLKYYIMYSVSVLPECIQVKKVQASLSLYFKNWLYYNLTHFFLFQGLQEVFEN